MNQPAPQHGVPPQHPQYGPGPYPPYPPPKKGMSAGKIILIIALVGVGVLFLFGVLVGVLAVATIPKLEEAKTKLEVKQVTDIREAFNHLSIDNQRKRELPNMGDASGRKFYEEAFQRGVLDLDLAPKLAALNGTDTSIQPSAASHALPPGNCSYTAPSAKGLLRVLASADSVVLVTFNSRNWNNYPDKGVIVAWTNQPEATWLTFEQANAQFGITRDEWNDPAGKLFGKKAPFQHTYE
jgi:hypothetical protein